MSEDRLQQECFLWFWNSYPAYRGLLFHVPNGGLRNSREAAKLKSMGLMRGVSDFIFLFRSKAYFIELKEESKGRQSKEQRDWQLIVEANGFEYSVCRSLEQFKEIILSKI